MGATNTTKWLNIASDLGITGGIISMACWANVTTAPGFGVFTGITYQGDVGTFVSNRIMYVNDTIQLAVWFDRNRGGIVDQAVQVATTLTLGTWYHLVYTYDGVNVEGWINGASQGTVAASGSGSNFNSDAFEIGSYFYNGSENLFSGLVDEVGVWSKKLSAQEIADLYNGGAGQTMVNVTSAIKTIDNLAKASVKNVDGLAIASVKTWNDLA